MNEYAVAFAMMAYLHNTSGYTFACHMFGADKHPNYLDEYASEYARAPSRAIGKLDHAHFIKLVDIAMKEHGEEAKLRYPD